MILIVDDKSENIISLQKTLDYSGFQTDTAMSGEEALRKVLKNTYSLIILDVQMPDMDGFEVAETILGYSKSKDTPIIFLSAVSTDKKFITKGYATGAIDYLTKPVDVDILLLKARILSMLGEQTQQLKETQAQLRSKNQQLFTTLESLPQVAYSATAYGVVEYTNIKWSDYSPAREIWPIGKCDGHTISDMWPKLIRDQVPFEREALITSISGESRYHVWKGVPVKSENQVRGWVGTFTDIHERKVASEILEKRVQERTIQLETQNKELEEVNLELQQFNTVASHDLKEPLRKVQTFIDIISHMDVAADAPKVETYLHKIDSSVRRMMSLLNNLLQYSRLSAKELFVPTDLNIILAEVLEDLEVRIDEKDARISYDILPTINCVPTQIRQVFQNIISNSLKFSMHDRQPSISISSNMSDSCPEINSDINPGPYCNITISDNGIGFDERFMHKIYVLFQRLNTQHQYEGTGIGLAVTKKIIDNHIGAISAKSELGEGTSFTITLSVHGPVLNDQPQ